MTRLAADAGIHVSGVIEKDKLRKIVNALPSDALARFPAFVDGRQFGALGVNRSQSSDALFIFGAMAIDAGRRGRHRRVGRVKYGVVTVTAIHLQLARVNRVAEWHRLFGLIPNVQCLRVRDQSTHHGGITATAGGR